jgi:hypothetical protein
MRYDICCTLELDTCWKMFVVAEVDPNGNTLARMIVSTPGKGVQYWVYPFSTGEFELA